MDEALGILDESLRRDGGGSEPTADAGCRRAARASSSRITSPLYTRGARRSPRRIAASTATTRRASRRARPASTSRRFIRKIAHRQRARLGAHDPVREPARLLVRARLPGRGAVRGRVRLQRAGTATPIQIGRLQRYAVETALARRGRGAARAGAADRQAASRCVGAGPGVARVRGLPRARGPRGARSTRSARSPAGSTRPASRPTRCTSTDALAEVDFVRVARASTIRDRRRGRATTSPADATCSRDYDAVFLGVGLGADSRLGIPGEDGPGVIGATALIERMKLEPGFALDGVRARGRDRRRQHRDRRRARARAARRPDGHACVYRRTEAEMPRLRARAGAGARARACAARGARRSRAGRSSDGAGAWRGSTAAGRVAGRPRRARRATSSLVAIGQARLRRAARARSPASRSTRRAASWSTRRTGAPATRRCTPAATASTAARRS